MSLKTEENEQTTQTQQSTEKDDSLPKTQEELDALIEKRLARQKKQIESASKLAPPPSQQTDLGKTVLSNGEEKNISAVQAAATDETVTENLMLKAQLCALKDGVLPTAVEDAVYLAFRTAQQKGEADSDGIEDALKDVLKRHPEWKKQAEDSKKTGGFKVGATGQENQTQTKKALPTGTVIL
ncbi:MAG: hypothetical protein RR198_05130 [Oscillospiraceae bacterium]